MCMFYISYFIFWIYTFKTKEISINKLPLLQFDV